MAVAAFGFFFDAYELLTLPLIVGPAFTDLAESYFKGGRRAEARKQTLAALEIAPSYERAQSLLLKLAEDKP